MAGAKDTLSNTLELFAFPALYLTFGFLLTNLLDQTFNQLFLSLQGRFGIAPGNSAWLVTQVVLQLIVTSIVNWVLQNGITQMLLQLSPDKAVYGRDMYLILTSFIMVFGQDHLQRRLKQLNENGDAWFQNKLTTWRQPQAS